MDKKKESPSKESLTDFKLPSSRGGYVLLSVLVGSVLAVCAWYIAGRGTHQKLDLVSAATEVAHEPVVATRPSLPVVQPVVRAAVPLGVVQEMALEHVLFYELIDQVRRGNPYQEALLLLQNLLGDNPLGQDLNAISQYAERGIPSLDRLTETALAQIEAHHTTSQEAENMAVRVLTSLVSVRKKSDHQAAFVEAIKHHELARAIQEGRGLIQEGYPLVEVVNNLQELEICFREVSRLEEAFRRLLGERIEGLKERTS